MKIFAYILLGLATILLLAFGIGIPEILYNPFYSFIANEYRLGAPDEINSMFCILFYVIGGTLFMILNKRTIGNKMNNIGIIAFILAVVTFFVTFLQVL
jgi:hypothetical protein